MTHTWVYPTPSNSYSGPLPAILQKGPWLELGKNMQHFGLFWEFLGV